MLIDLDNFKAINDQSGHAEGDRALTVAANKIVAAVRYQDPAGRIGGDEMALLLPGATRERAEAVGEQIISTLQEDGLSASVGISLDTKSSLSGMLREADRAMYEAKRGGGGSIKIS